MDYVDSPAYIYADGRGRFTRFDKAASDGQRIAYHRADGTVEVIPVGKCDSFGVWLAGRMATAVALDEGGEQIGPAETRLARGLVYVKPVPRAFSYLLKPASPAESALKCDRLEVVPGETVTVTGKTDHPFRVPADAIPGKSAAADCFLHEIGCYQESGWDSAYIEAGPDFDIATARHYFGPETPFRYVAAGGWHVLLIEELEWLHSTV